MRVSTVAEFAIREQGTTFEVNEMDGMVTVCVELISNVTLDRDITLELFPTVNGTADLNDFNSSALMYTFMPGSVAGTFLCKDIGIARDGIVEDIEDFSVLLRSSPEVSDVNIQQAIKVISILNFPLDSKSFTFSWGTAMRGTVW